MSYTIAGPAGRPLPPVSSATRAWWDETRRRRLTIQACGNCSSFQFYPRVMCMTCASDDLSLEHVRGTGMVYAHTVVERSPSPDHFLAPYVVALVELAEGPMLLTNIVGLPPYDVRCGLPVSVSWEPLSDGRHLPVFEPALERWE